jgi:hypothetical protein
MDPFEELQQAALIDVPRDECLRLLDVGRVGRVVYTDEDGPLAVPVNYRMDGKDVLFRVSPTSQLCLHLNHAAVSFEVDRLDEFHQTGWSILVRGQASYVESENLPAFHSERPVPWAQGPRPVYVRIQPSRITGRRLVDEKSHL